MFLEIEGDGRNRRLVNVTIMEKVQLHDDEETATLWAGGVPVACDSKIAYKFFVKRPAEFVTILPKE
jgi:hypothetical protein